MLPRLRDLAERHDVDRRRPRPRRDARRRDWCEPGTLDARRRPRPQAIAQACHAAGLLVLTCGTYGNVLRFLPPLVIDDSALTRGLDLLAEAFAAA